MKYILIRNATLGFTLLELLMVVSIMALIIGVGVYGFSDRSGFRQLSSAAQLVDEQLSLARQSAMSSAKAVEIRFLDLPSSGGNLSQFRGMVMVDHSSGEIMGKVVLLPSPVVFDSLPKYSTLISSLTNSHGGSMSIPSVGNVTYTGIVFYPGGGTLLDANGINGDRWFLTLRRSTAPSLPDRPAANFVTIDLDPLTGRSRVFKP